MAFQCAVHSSVYRQPLHISKLPINIITENVGFTMLGFLLTSYAERTFC